MIDKQKPNYAELEQRISELEKTQLEMAAAVSHGDSIKQLFDLSLDMLCIADIHGYFRIINPAFEKTLGYQPAELKALPFLDFVHPDDQASTLKAIAELSVGNPVFNFENRYRCKDGSYKWLHWTSMPRPDERLTYAVARDITKEKQAELQLLKERNYAQSIVDTAQAIILVLDNDGNILNFNPYLEEISGYKLSEVLGKPWFSTFIPEDEQKRLTDIFNQAINNTQTKGNINSINTKNGKEAIIEWFDTTLKGQQGKITGLLAIGHDVTQRIQSERLVNEKNVFIQDVIDGIIDPVMVINKDFSIVMMNKVTRQSLSKNQFDNLAQPKCYEVSHQRSTPCDSQDHICPLAEVLKTGKASKVIHSHLDANGNGCQVELSASPLLNAAGEVYAIVESSHDISNLLSIQSDLQKHAQALDYQAHHDNLTKLPNRLLFIDRLNQAIKQARRHKHEIAILFIDLDRFKEINDSLGHRVGDEVLKEVSNRLKTCIRETDTVARIGGDEYTVLIDAITQSSTATDIALKIIDKISKSIIIDKHRLYVTASIGIAIYPDDGLDQNVLLRNADSALYKSKEEGRNTYRYYTEDMTKKAFEHILLEGNLRQALQNNELIVHYQPQINASNNQIIGMEALVRWQHKELGLISPARFIPLAEETGLIIPLGEQVLRIATKQIAIWKQQGNTELRMAINFSVKQLQQKNIVSNIANILKENQCKPEWIELEVTEGYIMTNPKLAIKTLQELKAMNISISIDDFGTGYSSLSFLKHLPINKLKIDQSFIHDVPSDEDNKAIISAIISLAKSMNLNVIAEGVETQAQKAFLLEHDCNKIQGYYYSKPVAEPEMSKLLLRGIVST